MSFSKPAAAAFILLVQLLIIDAARTSFNIEVRHKSFGDEHESTSTSVVAHALQDLIDYLDLDADENIDTVASVLSLIPHNITVDLASSSTANAPGAMMIDSCFTHTPTYLFQFDRPDIVSEFSSRYFLLIPNSNVSQRSSTTSDQQSSSSPVVALAQQPLRSLRGASTTLPASRKWLHIQKTGSSFEKTALGLGFEDNSHDPCRYSRETCELVTLLREPSERLISWFYYDPDFINSCEDIKHMKSSVSLSEYKNEMKQCFNKFLRESLETNRMLAHPQLIRKSIYWGCEAKMISGYHCEDGLDTIEDAVMRTEKGLTEKAVSIINDESIFKFVGNIAFFEASVTLAHQVLGRGSINLKEDLAKMNTRQGLEKQRPPVLGGKDMRNVHYDSSYLCENNDLCENRPDDAVFAEMKRKMILNILKHHSNPVKIIGRPLDFLKFYSYAEKTTGDANDVGQSDGSECRVITSKVEKQYMF